MAQRIRKTCPICKRKGCDEKTMCIFSPPGTMVRFTDRNGHDYEREWALEVLSVGTVYEVAYTKVGSSKSGAALVGFKGLFNTVMFERA